MSDSDGLIQPEDAEGPSEPRPSGSSSMHSSSGCISREEDVASACSHPPPDSYVPSDHRDGAEEGSDLSHYFHFGSNKAGMNDDAADQKRRQEIIYEMSKDSGYFKRAQKVSERNQQRAAEMLQRMRALSAAQRMAYQARCDEDCLRLEARRDLSRICCVVDMDMFFAAVEIRDNPKLRDLPVAVGGMSMISTSNYVARKFGVRSAMPGFIAKRLCPDLVFVPCDFGKYEAASALAQEVVRRYEPGYKHDSGLDEFYIDITDCVAQRHAQLHGSSYNMSPHPPSIFELRTTAEVVVAEMRAAITASTAGLTCSAGIANNFFLAKICADRNKPNGQFSLPPSREDIIEFVRDLPCRKVGGIGKVSEKLLSDLGMNTIGDVAQNLASLYHVLTPSMLHFLTRTCMGVGRDEEMGQTSGRWGGDSSAGDGATALQKSVGTERTFGATEDRKELYMKLYDISLNVVSRIKEKGLHARQLTLKVKAADFDLFTRSTSRPLTASSPYFTEVDDVFAAAKELLDGFQPHVKIRLLGVSLSNFKEEMDISVPNRINKTSGQPEIASFFNKAGIGQSSESKGTMHKSNECIDHKEYEAVGVDSFTSYNCPVCNQDMRLPTLAALNDHIDECLSLSALREEGEGGGCGDGPSRGDVSRPDAWTGSTRKRRKLDDYMMK